MTQQAQAATEAPDTPRPAWGRRLASDAFWVLDTLLWTTAAPFVAGGFVLWALVMVALILGWGLTEWSHALLLAGDILTRAGEHPEVASRLGQSLQVWIIITSGPVLIRRIARTPLANRAATRLQGNLDRLLAPVAEPFDRQPFWVRAGAFLALLVLSGLVITWLT